MKFIDIFKALLDVNNWKLSDNFNKLQDEIVSEKYGIRVFVSTPMIFREIHGRNETYKTSALTYPIILALTLWIESKLTNQQKDCDCCNSSLKEKKYVHTKRSSTDR